MGLIQNTVHYCSVSKGNRTFYVYSGGDHEIENLAALSLERTPLYHKWYFETIGKRTFGFFIDDGFVYFTIVDKGCGNSGVLEFLEHVRDEFKKVARMGSRGSFSSMSSINVQDQLVPVIHRLITTLLEHVSQIDNHCNAETSSSDNLGLSPSPSNLNGQIDVASSTKAPLLGKNKHDKKSKDHVIAMRDVELEEHRISTDRGSRGDSTAFDSTNPVGVASPIALQKDLGGSMRTRSSSQSLRKKWWRQLRIILAIDAAVCLILFIIWLSICGGFGCTR